MQFARIPVEFDGEQSACCPPPSSVLGGSEDTPVTTECKSAPVLKSGKRPYASNKRSDDDSDEECNDEQGKHLKDLQNKVKPGKV